MSSPKLITGPTTLATTKWLITEPSPYSAFPLPSNLILYTRRRLFSWAFIEWSVWNPFGKAVTRKRVQKSMERIYKLKMHFHVSVLSVIAKLTCGIRLKSLRITPTQWKSVSNAENQFHYKTKEDFYFYCSKKGADLCQSGNVIL